MITLKTSCDKNRCSKIAQKVNFCTNDHQLQTEKYGFNSGFRFSSLFVSWGVVCEVVIFTKYL